MKRLLLILILTFSLQSWTKADEINEISIEGISVGESALKYFSKQDIKNNSWDYYKNKKFTPVQNKGFSFFKQYDSVDFDFKTNDKDYLIHSLSGVIFFKKEDIKKCFKMMNEIDIEISKVLQSFKRSDKATWIHDMDPTGKSKFTDIYYESESGTVTITCYDYSEEQIAKGSGNHLAVMISLNEWVNFMRSNPYK